MNTNLENLENGVFHTPEECAKWLAEYTIGEIDTDYEPQRKWCLHLLDGAIHLMKAFNIPEITLCGEKYTIVDLVKIDHEHNTPVSE